MLAVLLGLAVIISIAAISGQGLVEAVHETLLLSRPAEQLSTLTGRLNVWDSFIDQALRRPWLGYGFAAGSRVGDHYMNTAHNVFLAVFLDGGIFGGVLLLIVLVTLTIKTLNEIRRGTVGAKGISGVLLAALIACQSTPFFGVYWSAPSAVFAGFIALLCHPPHTYARFKKSKQGRGLAPYILRTPCDLVSR